MFPCRGPGSTPGQGSINRRHRPQLKLGAANINEYLIEKKMGTKHEKIGKNDKGGVDDVRKKVVLL